MENDENNPKDQQPSTSELLGTSPEQIKRQNGEADEPVYESETSNHTLYQMYIGTASIILVILGIVILGIWFFSATSETEEEPVSITPERFFAINGREEVSLRTATNIQQELEVIEEAGAAPESFTQIYFTENIEVGKRLVSASSLMQRLSDGERTVGPYLEDEYMYGLYGDADGESYPYLVFKVSNYDRSYGTMLQTEEALVSALRELLFPPVTGFGDVIILNQDVRVATGGAGRSLFYSFPRPDTLVITTNETVLREIFSRL